MTFVPAESVGVIAAPTGRGLCRLHARSMGPYTPMKNRMAGVAFDCQEGVERHASG